MGPKVSGHSHIGREARLRTTRKLGIVLGVTAGFTLVQIVGSIVSNSLTLMAEASHMGTDVAALGLAVLGSRIALRREGSIKRFGNLRWEVLAAMVNGLALFVIAIMITVEALDRFRNPRPIDATVLGGIAVLGLLVNIFALKTLHGHHHHDLNARGAYLHIAGDVLGSIGAIIGAIIIHYTGKLFVDPLISILVSLVILRSAWRLIRESGLILLDRVPVHVPAEEVERRLNSVPGVTRVHDLHVWAVTSGLTAMSAHVVAPALASHPETLRRLESEMLHLGIEHVTIQLETDDGCIGIDCDDPHSH